MNNAEHEDFLELLRVYRRVTVSGQTLETAVMKRFLWNTKGRLSSLKASVRLTTSTPDDVVLTIVDSVQVGERVQVALGAEFVDNHEYELREMRKITLTVGFLRGDEDFIRDCIGNWYRGVGLTPQQYTNVLYRGYHKSINVEVGIGLLTQAGDRLVVNLDPLVIHAEAHSLLGALTGSATGVVHGAGVSQVIAPGGIPSGEMVGIPGVGYQQGGNGITEILSYIQSGRISVEQVMKWIGEGSRYPQFALYAGKEKQDHELLALIAGRDDTDLGDFFRELSRTELEEHAGFAAMLWWALKNDPTKVITTHSVLRGFGLLYVDAKQNKIGGRGGEMQREPRGASAGTYEKVREAHRLRKQGKQWREVKKTCSHETYTQWCFKVTGEDPV